MRLLSQFVGASRARQALLLRVGRSLGVDRVVEERAVSVQPLRLRMPVLAVPLDDFGGGIAFVVRRGHLERAEQTGRADFLDPLRA